MDNSKLAETIDAAWEKRDTVNSATKGEIARRGRGGARGARRRQAPGRRARGRPWVTHQWLKKAVLLSFRLQRFRCPWMSAASAYDKVPLKFDGWGAEPFPRGGISRRAGLRRPPLGLYRARAWC